MKTSKIIEGIREATCRAELSAHMDLLEKAIERGACDFDASEWLYIASEVDTKLQELNNRVFH